MHPRRKLLISFLLVIAAIWAAVPTHAVECSNSGAVPATDPDDSGIATATVCGDGAVSLGAGGTAVGDGAKTESVNGTALGHSAFAKEEDSIAIGNASATGAKGVSIGPFALSGLTSSVAIGASSNASGNFSVALGKESGAGGAASLALGPDSDSSGLGSTAIGWRSFADKDYSIVLGSIAGVNAATVNAVVGIGTTSPLAPLHIARDDATQEMLYLESNELGVTQDRAMMYLANNGGLRFQFDNNVLGTSWRFQAATGNQDRFEVTKVGTGAIEMAVDASGNLEIRGTLTELSDRDSKQEVERLNGAWVLDRLSAMPVTEWSYKHAPRSRRVGPMAQDFFEAFGLGEDDKRISARDMAGVSLIAIQELEQRNSELEHRNATLEGRVEELEEMFSRFQNAAGE